MSAFSAHADPTDAEAAAADAAAAAKAAEAAADDWRVAVRALDVRVGSAGWGGDAGPYALEYVRLRGCAPYSGTGPCHPCAAICGLGGNCQKAKWPAGCAVFAASGACGFRSCRLPHVVAVLGQSAAFAVPRGVPLNLLVSRTEAREMASSRVGSVLERVERTRAREADDCDRAGVRVKTARLESTATGLAVLAGRAEALSTDDLMRMIGL